MARYNKNASGYDKKTIEIPAPVFEMYQDVTVYWNGKESRNRIVNCRFDLTDECWSYQVQNDPHFYYQNAIEPR